MRLVPRILLLSVLVTIIFLIVGIRYFINQERTAEEVEDDAVIHILQALPEDSQASEGLSNHQNPPPLTLNIAIILVVSLLTVALLISGIIIVAVTMDPNMSEEDPLLNELNSNSSDLEFDDSDDLYFDKAVRSHFPSEFEIFDDVEIGHSKKPPPQRRKSFSN